MEQASCIARVVDKIQLTAPSSADDLDQPAPAPTTAPASPQPLLNMPAWSSDGWFDFDQFDVGSLNIDHTSDHPIFAKAMSVAPPCVSSEGGVSGIVDTRVAIADPPELEHILESADLAALPAKGGGIAARVRLAQGVQKKPSSHA
eukprot:12941612-Alexandrium_andersonii.AAC.1